MRTPTPLGDVFYFTVPLYSSGMLSSGLLLFDFLTMVSYMSTGALGRNQAHLCIHRNLSGDPALDGHDVDVNAKITQIHELLRVCDGLDRICEFTENDTEEFLGHISTFWCVMLVGSRRCGCLVARFCCQKQHDWSAGWPRIHDLAYILNILIYFLCTWQCLDMASRFLYWFLTFFT